MPILDSKLATRFVSILERLEKIEPTTESMSQYERRFISDMRDHWDGREAQSDLGLMPWNPSLRQWEYMQTLGERYP